MNEVFKIKITNVKEFIVKTIDEVYEIIETYEKDVIKNNICLRDFKEVKNVQIMNYAGKTDFYFYYQWGFTSIKINAIEFIDTQNKLTKKINEIKGRN